MSTASLSNFVTYVIMWCVFCYEHVIFFPGLVWAGLYKCVINGSLSLGDGASTFWMDEVAFIYGGELKMWAIEFFGHHTGGDPIAWWWVNFYFSLEIMNILQMLWRNLDPESPNYLKTIFFSRYKQNLA